MVFRGAHNNFLTIRHDAGKITTYTSTNLTQGQSMKPNYRHDIQTIEKMSITARKFLQKTKKFLQKSGRLKKSEMLYVLKATLAGNGDVVVHGAYYGAESTSLRFILEHKGDREEIFLGEALDKKALVEYLCNHQDEKNLYNLYVFKVSYKRFSIQSIESLYGGSHNFTISIMHTYDEDSKDNRNILKILGEVKYVPELMELYGDSDNIF